MHSPTYFLHSSLMPLLSIQFMCTILICQFFNVHFHFCSTPPPYVISRLRFNTLQMNKALVYYPLYAPHNSITFLAKVMILINNVQTEVKVIWFLRYGFNLMNFESKQWCYNICWQEQDNCAKSLGPSAFLCGHKCVGIHL